MSVTTTLKAGQNAMLFALSLAEHVTVVVPRTNALPEVTVEPEDVKQELEAIPELSTAWKFHVTVAVGVLPFIGIADNGDEVMYGGHINVGGVVSTLTMVNEHEEDAPFVSKAVQFTARVLKAVRFTGLEMLHSVRATLLPVEAVTTGAANVAVAVTDMPLFGDVNIFAGHVIDGGAELATLKVKVPPAIKVAFETTTILNSDVTPDGMTEKVKELPPSFVANPEGIIVAVAVKSDAIPEVGPLIPTTVIVHKMATPT